MQTPTSTAPVCHLLCSWLADLKDTRRGQTRFDCRKDLEPWGWGPQQETKSFLLGRLGVMGSLLARQSPKSRSDSPPWDTSLTKSKGSGFGHLFLTSFPTEMHKWSLTYCLQRASEPALSCRPFYLIVLCCQQLDEVIIPIPVIRNRVPGRSSA